MKIKGVLILILFPLSIFSQNWEVTSLPANINGQRYDDVFFIDENVGWAANGFYAAVYKTTDGGINWTEQLTQADLGEEHYFRNIEFLNADIGFLGTLDGKFYKSINGGDDWQLVTNITPNPLAICGLNTVGLNTVYGCGAFFTPAYIIKSIDSGESWTYTNMSAFANSLVEIKFVDENLGYAAGGCDTGGCILKTIDGGTTWTEIYNSNIAGQIVWKLQIFKETPNIIFGSVESSSPNIGKLVKSFDSGENWISLDAPEVDIQAVGFINENRGWMGGHNTGIHETIDGGQTWTNLNIGGNLNRIFVLKPDLVFATGTSVYRFSNVSLGIEDINTHSSKSLDVKLSSNPVNDLLEFSIEFEGFDNIVIELYDIKGSFIKRLTSESVRTEILNRDYSFNVENLQAGLYFINVHNNYNRESIQFIKN